MPELTEVQADHILIGVDVGGSGVKGAPVDTSAGVLTEERLRIPTPHPATPAAVAETVRAVVDHFAAVGPIGVTLPGVIRSGVVCTAANIDESWLGTDVTALMSATTGRDATVLNDADAAGLAEVEYGAGRGVAGVVLMLTLGTGIGSALFVDGTLVPNTELGHLHLHGGDAEDYAASSVKEEQELSWKHYAHRLEQYIHLVEGLLWPDLIIIGGGISKKSERFLPLISSSAPLMPAELHNNSGIVGAAMAARRPEL
jgi:polyphosphate glucokinase